MNLRMIIRDEVGVLCKEYGCNDTFLDNLDGLAPLLRAIEELVKDAQHGPNAQASFQDYANYMQRCARRIENLADEL